MGEKIYVVVTVDGGLVESVMSNQEICVTIIDKDLPEVGEATIVNLEDIPSNVYSIEELQQTIDDFNKGLAWQYDMVLGKFIEVDRIPDFWEDLLGKYRDLFRYLPDADSILGALRAVEDNFKSNKYIDNIALIEDVCKIAKDIFESED